MEWILLYSCCSNYCIATRFCMHSCVEELQIEVGKDTLRYYLETSHYYYGSISLSFRRLSTGLPVKPIVVVPYQRDPSTFSNRKKVLLRLETKQFYVFDCSIDRYRLGSWLAMIYGVTIGWDSFISSSTFEMCGRTQSSFWHIIMIILSDLCVC